MKKKRISRAGCILATVLIVFLCATAQAKDKRTLSELRESCQEGWHETYASHGRTIEVDLEILLPNAERFPVVYADPLPMTGDQGNAEASTVNNHVEEWRSDGILRVDYPDSGVLRAAQREHPEAAISDGYNQYSIIRQITEFETDKPYAYNNPTTVADAQALLEEAGKTYFPEAQIELMPHWLRAYQGDMKYDRQNDTYSGDPLPQSEATLMVYFDQIIRDIPVLGCAAQSFAQYAGINSKEKQLMYGAIAITQGYKRFGIDELYRSLQFYLVQEREVIAQDVPLCSFQQVKNTYENLIEEGKLRSISSLRLGYIIWQNEGPYAYTLMPTWVAEGELFPDATSEKPKKKTQYDTIPANWGYVMVNAQTGELIDPWKKGKNRSFDCPDLLTWED